MDIDEFIKNARPEKPPGATKGGRLINVGVRIKHGCGGEYFEVVQGASEIFVKVCGDRLEIAHQIHPDAMTTRCLKCGRAVSPLEMKQLAEAEDPAGAPKKE